MTSKRNNVSKNNSSWKAILIGYVISILTTVLLAAIFAKFVEQGKIQEIKIDYVIAMILLIAVFLGNCITQSKIQERRLIVTGIITFLYTLLLMIANVAIWGGDYCKIGPRLLMVVCGGISAFLLKIQSRNGAKRKHAKLTYR